MNSVKLFLQLE